ncbi:nuclear pore complex protein Nup153 isoform X2 [Varanus komodoensis]|uniref:nuclear pore complex protein Nup153 isoform X2 n=1 Tax=Varanus komodoensis TaxID=61221 RepID=UPI001CF7C24A|nr:nuclear pore complex protein Nup153 isoform X2 [Varanus komodoensis]
MDSGESSGGGGGGGGKIRTRRYHLAAASSKPYPRSKQGIMNIVKESVKSIVPTWLQRYFKQNEETSPGEQRSLEENINYHPAFADDITDNTLEIDGRITPDPTRITLEEPSTSRSGLNFTDILTRPSLHRSHLNCNILESPSPLCQPSTSSAFPISNSGLSLGKEMKDSTSQHDDDNISTTSGFSSRASDKDIAVSKTASVPPLWSTDLERPVRLSQHSASSSKKPGFNLSAFGTLSPSLGNASVLKTSQLGNSPFYPGKTMYGGAAAAARQSKLRITPYQTPIRRQMKAKQVNTQAYGVTSSTARRILQSLEKMSSPLADAKRIPSSVSSSLSPVERSMLNITDFHSPRKKVESHYPPVQKLVTPKTVSLSVSRSQYFKPSLTSAAESGRIRQRIEMNHKAGQEKNLAVEQQMEQPASVTNPKFSASASNGLPPAVGGGGGKMRREKGVHYVSKPAEEEEMEMPVLPEISLPISTSSLPTFSFGPLPNSTISSSPDSGSQSVTNKVQPAGKASSPVFRFSSPIVKSTEAEVLPPVSVGGFKFSVPVAKSSDPSGTKNTPLSSLMNTATNSISNKKENEYDGPFKPAKILKAGSVLDVLKSPGFASPATPPMYSSAATPPVATSTVVYTRPTISSFSRAVSGLGDTVKQASTHWQCDTCLIQNKLADNKCIACQAAKVLTSDGTKQAGTLTQNITVKSAVSTTATKGFGDKFKAAAGTWDCDTCLVQNKPEATKCVACETPKPGTGVKQALVLPFVTDSATTVSSSLSSAEVPVTLGLGDKFKKPKGSWECSVCSVSNKAESNRCVACQSDKVGGSAPVVSSSASSLPALSGGFLGLDKFKKPEGSWDCETCLVENKADASKCVACETAKPGSKIELKGFGTTITTTTTTTSAPSAPSFTFGIQSSSSESHPILGNAGKNFKFGEQTGFKFGITSELGSSTNTVAGDFKFSKNESSKLGSFPSESKSEDSVKDSKNNSTFSFGLPSGASITSTTSFQFGIANLGQQEKKEGPNKPAVGAFTFGTGSTTSTAASENKTGISSFTFGNSEEKEVTLSPFSSKTTEGKKDEIPSTKGGFTFGNMESMTVPQLVLGRTDEKQESDAPSNPLVFGKKSENEETKAQSVFSFGKAEQTKDDGTVKTAFSFSLAKPVEKEAEQQTKPTFTFGAKANAADPGSAKPAFSFLSASSSNTAVPSGSVGGGSNSIFSTTTSSSSTPAPTFLFGQASNTVSSSAFGNPSDSSTSQSFGFSQESKPPTTTSSTSTPVPFLFGTVPTTNSTANTGFSFAARTTTAAPTGSSSSFVFGSGSSAPPTGPAFGASQTPAFRQGQGSSQSPVLTFGSLSSSSLFPTGSQAGPPTFGSVSSSTQPPIFGQQASQQPGFGSGTAPNSGGVFQFGSSTANFNFTGNNPGVFTFGATPGVNPAQPAGSSAFSFTQPSSFNLGNNGKNIFSVPGSSVPGRKIKTAVRRRK